MNFLLIGGIFFLAFLLRTLLHFKYQWIGLDTFTHLLCALKIRKSKSLFKGRECIIDDYAGIKYYPPFFHIFLSLFPKKFHKKLQIFPTLFDLFNMVVLLFFVQRFISEQYIYLALLIYSLAPILILSSLTLSPRTAANLLLSISLLFLFFYLTFNSIFYLFLFTFMASFIFPFHRLTLQSLVIVILSISLIFSNPLPLIALLTSLGIAFLITKGKYKMVLKTHLKHLAECFKRGHYLYRTKRPENPIKLFFACPFVTIPIVYLILNGFTAQFLFFQVWFFSLLLTSFFWIWGDGYRYLTNAVFPASVLAAVFLERLPASNLFFNLLLLASFMGTSYIFWKFVNSRRVIKSEFIRCCNYIRKKAKKKDTLAVLSPQSYWYIGAYFTQLNTYPHRYYKGKLVFRKEKIENPNWIITYEKINHKYELKFEAGRFKVFQLQK